MLTTVMTVRMRRRDTPICVLDAGACNVPTRIIAQQYAIPSGSKRHCAWLRMVAHVVRNTVPNTAEQRRNSPPRAQYPPLHITEHHPIRPEPADPHRPPPRIRETRGTFRGHRRRPHHATPPGARNPPQAGRNTVGNRTGDAPHARHHRRTSRQRKTGAGDIPIRRSGIGPVLESRAISMGDIRKTVPWGAYIYI